MKRNILRSICATSLVLALVMTSATISRAKISMKDVTSTATPSIHVEKLSNYDENSIRGVDVSSVISMYEGFDAVREQMKADGKSDAEIATIGYKDAAGNVLDKAGFFKLLKDSGVNLVRTRVWNDPYDEDGNGYGGGNCDLDNAIEIAKLATDAGMKNSIDFHLSDFWADPGRAYAPKAWTDFTVDQKAAAVAKYVKDALTQIESAGGKVAMVQIGNEIDAYCCGEDEHGAIMKIVDAGCDAVHTYNPSIQTIIHLTDPQDSAHIYNWVADLASYDGDGDGKAEGVSYDIFAMSYYPFWHGAISNMKSVLQTIAKKYDKYVMIGELGWCFTTTDGDGQTNTINSSSSKGDAPYDFSVQGEADAIYDVAKAVNDITTKKSNGDKAALGFIYYEPAWIPVQSIVEKNSSGTYVRKSNASEIIASNKRIWETVGCGVATPYTRSYDPNGDAPGGSVDDNRALFDFDGTPLESLSTYKYLLTGAYPDANEFDIISSGTKLHYEMKGSSVTLSKVISTATSLTVPATIKYGSKTYKVTAIGKKAASTAKNLKTVTIGKSVTSIGASAFTGISGLKTVNINSKKISSVGKSAFKGIYKKAKFNIKQSKSSYKKTVKLIKKSGVAKAVKYVKK